MNNAVTIIDVNENMEYYWKLISNDNLISMLVKRIEMANNEVVIQIKNVRG